MTTVEKIKAKILDLAIRGKLVSQNPDDEPASVLLGRIKAEKAKLVKAGKIKKDKNPSEIVVGSDGATYEKFADGTTKDLSKEIPFALPQGWALQKVCNFTLVVTDFVASGSFAALRENVKYYSEPNYAVLLRTKDLNSALTSDFVYTDKRGYDFLVNSRLYGGELVLPNIGASIGKVFVVPQTAFKMTLAPNAILVRCFHADNLKWLHMYFQSTIGQKALHQISSATAQGKFNKTDFRNLIIPIPPIAEQKRIAAEIEELFAHADKIGDAADGISQAAARINKKILGLAIRGQLVPQDPNDEPASELIKRIEAAKKATAKGRKSSRIAASDRPAYEIEPPFEIPDSWEWVKLGNLVKIIAGVSYQKDDVTRSGVRILRGGNIKEDANIHLFDDDVFLPLNYANEESTIHSGDIVIVASTGSSTVIGRPAVAKEALPGIQIGAFLRIVRPVVDEVESWMPVLFLGDYYRLHIRGKSKGTNIKNLKAEYLSDLLIPLPPVAEQKRIVAKIKELRAMTRSLTK